MCCAGACCAMSASGPAIAQTSEGSESVRAFPPALPAPDTAKPAIERKAAGEQRPFVFTMDPSIPHAGEVSLDYTAQGATGVEAMRPLAANLGARGIVHGLTASVGVAPWLAVFGSGLAHQAFDDRESAVRGTGQAGLRWLASRPGAPLRLGASTFVLREFEGSVGAAARLVASYDFGRLRIAGNAHVEKVFAAHRDSIDLLAFAGASLRATRELRLGVEYVGQDLEDAFEHEEAEGGARHFAGPTAALELQDGRLWITAGPALGLNAKSPPFQGRLSVVATF